MTASQMDAPELLPCPFCGGAAHVDGTSWTTRDGKDQAWATCKKCGTYGPSSTNAIAAWNRRATPEALAADPAVKALVEAAEARVWKLAAERLALAEHDAEERDWRSGANAFAALAKGFRAEAAAIRGETP